MIVATSTETDEVMGALANSIAAIEDVPRAHSVDVGNYSYSYADLKQVLDAVRAACDGNGLAVSQTPHDEGGRVAVSTTIIHPSGQWVTFAPLAMPGNIGNPQGAGSAISYARRYALMAIFNMAAEDDDGRAASTPPGSSAPHDGFRTAAEAAIHEQFALHPADWGARVRDQFREEFGCGLRDLPVGRHGEALWFVAAFLPDPHPDEHVPDPTPIPEEDTSGY